MRSVKARSVASWVALCALTVAASAADPPVRVELNRLQPLDGGCRMHLVVENASASRFAGFQLDLVIFGGDGIVARRVTLDASPLRARKTSVYAFDVPTLACDAFGRMLLNDVPECATAEGPVEDCVSSVEVSSRAGVDLVK